MKTNWQWESWKRACQRTVTRIIQRRRRMPEQPLQFKEGRDSFSRDRNRYGILEFFRFVLFLKSDINHQKRRGFSFLSPSIFWNHGCILHVFLHMLWCRDVLSSISIPTPPPTPPTPPHTSNPPPPHRAVSDSLSTQCYFDWTSLIIWVSCGTRICKRVWYDFTILFMGTSGGITDTSALLYLTLGEKKKKTWNTPQNGS